MKTSDISTPVRGFSLIELMVVIGVVALLAAIVLTLGPKVLGDQKTSGTRSMLLALDRMYEDYVASNGGAQPFFDVNDYAGVPGKDLVKPGDGKNETVNTSMDEAFSQYPPSGSPVREYPRFPDAAVFLRQALASGVGDSVLSSFAARNVVITATQEDSGAPGDETDRTPSLMDLWGPNDPAWEDEGYVLLKGLPILFVHPSNLLAQQMYGRCVNGRGYFLSAGGDRLYGATNQLTAEGERSSDDAQLRRAVGALKDNVYSTDVGPADTLSNNGMYSGTFSGDLR